MNTRINFNAVQCDFILNTIHAYQNFQSNSNEGFDGIKLDNIFAFTAHLSNAAGSVHQIQSQLDGICQELQQHISLKLLGKSYKNIYKQKLQPMLIASFDYEGTREGKVLDKCQLAHLHGIILIHPKNNKFLDRAFYQMKNKRYSLHTPPQGLKEFSMAPIYGGIKGLNRYIGYSIKQSQLDIKTDNNYFGYQSYPRTKLWLQYLSDRPKQHLEHYKSGSFH